MPFFQDLSKKVADAAKEVGKRTSEATEVVRLNSRVATIQDEIERLFSQIGKAYYSMRDTAGESDAAKALCAQVDKLTSELAGVKAELDRLKNLSRCPDCGEVQASSALFCSSCGAKMPVLTKPEPEAEQSSESDAEEAKSLADQPEITLELPKDTAEETEKSSGK